MPDPILTFPHLEWRRLKRTDQRGKAQKSSFPPPPPLRPNPTGHRQQINKQAGEAIDDIVKSRRALGVKPQHLLVLEMDFIQANQRATLEAVGARILDEGEQRTKLAEPYYCNFLTFDTPRARQNFTAKVKELASIGLTQLKRDRGTQGVPHETKCTACFATLEQAKVFHGDASFQQRNQFRVQRTAPKKESSEIRYKWLVEFPDLAIAESFKRAARGQSTSVGIDKLNATERTGLLDAIEKIRALGPEDRKGNRLKEEGPPDGIEEFAIDVDIWYPSTPKEIQRELREFEALVKRHGGRVTDGPLAVANTFFIARVKGDENTLDAILNYDRVACADLPPKLPPMPSTIFRKVEIPGGIPAPPEDAPLACLVDSGVLPTHPLLSGWVVDSQDFDSGEDTPIDKAGHGTHLAGIVVYGDIYNCLQRQSWKPSVRLLSAKVLREMDGDAVFPEDSDERIESQLRNAITTFNKERGCRVFNLSIGHLARPYLGGRQQPWALMLDELARDLNVVLVVAAGNVISPEVPSVSSEPHLRREVLKQLLTDDHAILDPASSMLSLTVGSVARNERTWRRYEEHDFRPPLVGSPAYGPSPFTRTGVVATSGAGPAKAIKPDLVWYGGNNFLDNAGGWYGNDALMGEPSLNLTYRENGRLLKAACGTSVAAPFVTHVCARIEHALKKLGRWNDTPPSANLIRALAVHSAEVPKACQSWIEEVSTEVQNRLRLIGYGLPSPARALWSTDQRVVLLAEDALEDDYYHIYELEIPATFAKLKKKRLIRVTLAYDPPVRGTRKEYLIRKLYFRFIKDHTVDQIEQYAAVGKDCDQPAMEPGIDWVKDSTVQSAWFEGTQARSFSWDGEEDSFTRWHVVVRSEPRLDAEDLPPQKYALVVSLEHSDEAAKVYNRVKNRIAQKIRLGG